MTRILAFMAGATCGAIVGAVAALLLAPISGDDLRGGARRRVDEVLSEGRKAAAERRNELEQQLRNMQQG
jgi:gas vesicle protein